MPSSPLRPQPCQSRLAKRKSNFNAAGSRKLPSTILFSLAIVVATVSFASAQEVSSLAKFVAGGAIGLGLHEGGHVVVDLSLGSTPGLRQVHLGWLPFFAITHEQLSPAGEFATSSAGFWMQHLSSELRLSRHPGLRRADAPMLKGLLAFNVVASGAYSVAAFVRGGPAERDTRGMAVSADIPEPWVGVSVLLPAVLDAARYYRPEAAWLKWVSRATKVGGALLIVKAVGRNADL